MIPILVARIGIYAATQATPPPAANNRVTEAGDNRVTEIGDNRVTEGS